MFDDIFISSLVEEAKVLNEAPGDEGEENEEETEEQATESDGGETSTTSDPNQPADNPPTEGEPPEIPDLGEPPGESEDEQPPEEFSVEPEEDSEDVEGEDSESPGTEDEDDYDEDMDDGEVDMNKEGETNEQYAVLELSKVDRVIATQKCLNSFMTLKSTINTFIDKIISSESSVKAEIRDESTRDLTSIVKQIDRYLSSKFRYTVYEENVQVHIMLSKMTTEIIEKLSNEGFKKSSTGTDK